MFEAIYIDQCGDGHSSVELTELNELALPDGEVSVAVEYSTLNYKDALAITGKGQVVRAFPMIPGIDLAGIVTKSRDVRFAIGDRVFVNGWGMGERFWGGLAQCARGKGDWFLPLPRNLSSCDAMGLGTAGYTAMLCVQTLEAHGVTPDKGEVLVTGASGGVGSIALNILANRGYRVVASTGHSDNSNYLLGLGASEVIDRKEHSQPGRPLGKERWAGAVDVVGSQTLANVCASTKYGGVVTACGLTQGMDLPLTVAPFILRGVSLIGIDSVYCPIEKRRAAWAALEHEWDVALRHLVTRCIPLSEVIDQASAMINGKVKGRLVVDVNA